MKVFLAVKSLLPSYGGPAFSVSRLALALADAGAEVGLWASDMSAEKSPLLTRHPRVQPITGLLPGAVDRFGRPDILHDNGIWLPHNHHLASLAARRNLVRVVSTRGMLEPWAIGHKKSKKRLAWWLYQRRDLRRASFHHTTAPAEAQNLLQFQLGVPVGVIPNGVDEAHVDHSQRQRSETRTALFLGRLHPVKGLSLLLDAWVRLRPAGWQLQIAGPDEIGYRSALEKKITAASLSQTVHFSGPLDGAAKERAFLNADLFVLPSFSESFGMAIGEALAHGLPVLTTTGAPWPMIAQRGCGWSVAPTVDGITDGLRRAIALDPARLAAMGETGRDLVRSDFAWPNVAKQFLQTYESLLRRKSEI
jgi:glycosyltransferase involved in cell wall biosynthesis